MSQTFVVGIEDSLSKSPALVMTRGGSYGKYRTRGNTSPYLRLCLETGYPSLVQLLRTQKLPRIFAANWMLTEIQTSSAINDRESHG